MHVVLTSHGSTGDIYPMIALGLALRDAGHSVRFATSPPFRQEVEQAGLDYAELPPRWSIRELSHWMGRLQLYSNPILQLRELYRAAQPHIQELTREMDRVLRGADILVSSYLFPTNRALADRHGIPFATFAFAHNTVPSRYHPPDGVPRLRGFPPRIQQTWNRWVWRIANVAVDTVINLTISRQLKSCGLPPVRNFFSRPARLVLVAVSPGLMKPPFKTHSRFRFVGYCRWQGPADPTREREVVEFTGGEAVPVLSFGSMVYQSPELWMQRLAAAWPRDRRLIVQRGWSGFPDLPDHPQIRLLGPMSHDRLFQHASVVIHHGGAGTTASVLHSGKPQIVVPHIADQEFFAREVVRLGCGVKLSKQRWPERLAATVARCETDAALAAAAARAREIVLAEDGPGCARAEIERFVNNPGAVPTRPNRNANADRELSPGV